MIMLINTTPISNIKEENYDICQPKQIDVSKADSWIRYKFELVYKIKVIEPPMEMRNIEFFNLIRDNDKKIYAPIIYNFDTKLMNKIPKPKYFKNSNVLIQQHCNEDMEKIISKYLNHKSSLFFSQKIF